MLFGGYNPKKVTITTFLGKLSANLDHYMNTYDNLLLIGDFNSQVDEQDMTFFCETYDLKNLIKEPTCYKSLTNPSNIDLTKLYRQGYLIII